ncbi:Protein mono-ADP-ribosyltransferase PARP8 [Lamellibrachia satsuma]|nr:Protein mono-ADP-ribosyltransferase PARP8 [Lamellibrachia satsuma]
MRADIQAIISACDIDPDCPFKDFEFKDDSFSFNFYEANTLLKYVTFNLSDDYPDHTVLTTCGPPGSRQPCETKAFHQRLPVIFRDLTAVMYKKMNVSLPGMVQRSNDQTDDESSDDISDDDDDPAEASDDEEEGEEAKMNALLACDIEYVRKLYGSHALDYRAFHSIDDIDVSLSIDMKMLDSETAAAWKVKKDEPIIIRLHMSLSQYLDGSVPKVAVSQPSQKEKFSIGSQLCKILESFIKSNWTLASEKEICSAARTKDFCSGDISDSTLPTVGDDALAQILSMGFPLTQARNALAMSGGDTGRAVNLLITDQDCLGLTKPSSPPGDTPPKLPARPQYLVPVQKQVRAKSVQKQTMKKMKATKQEAATGNRSSPLVAPRSSTGTSWSQSLAQRMSSVLTRHDPKAVLVHGEEAKEVPTLEFGFLVQVMKYARQRLLTLNEFCVVCDEPHVFQNGAMLKPAVCARELCIFSFQTLGVMSDAAEDIATQPEVVEVLVTMAGAACMSQRQELIFDPYPTVVDPKNPSDLAFEPRNKNFEKVSKALDAFLSMQQMTNLYGSQLKQELDRRNILAYPLLQWIITSNRSHIVKLPEDKQLAFMHTPHQFLLLSSPPAKEAIFRAERQKYGSTFAFHGSPLENWHSILRHGLMNASDTKLQMNGRVHGKGIYLSPMSSTSFGYSRMAQCAPSIGPARHGATRGAPAIKTKERFLRTKNPKCVALCEVVTSDCLKKCTNAIWLTQNPDHVCTRFFFVYEDDQAGDSQVDTQSNVYKDKILQAVTYQFR